MVMRNRLATPLATAAKRLIWLGATVNLLVFSLYFYKFAPGHLFTLSSSQEVWAFFGTFVGGMLGPYFSFLAFIAVIVTVVLQASQLDIAREQAVFEEIQRVMTAISSRLDELLAQKPAYHAAKVPLRDEPPITLHAHIMARGRAALDTSEKSSFNQGFNHDVITAVHQDIAMSLAAMNMELHQLAWCLGKYEEKGGSDTVLEFYRFRFGAIACWMEASGDLPSDLARTAFKVASLRTVFTPAQANPVE